MNVHIYIYIYIYIHKCLLDHQTTRAAGENHVSFSEKTFHYYYHYYLYYYYYYLFTCLLTDADSFLISFIHFLQYLM